MSRLPRSRVFPFLPVLLALLVLSAGCGKQEAARARFRRVAADSGARIRARLGFQPPADGILTDAQIDHYLKVQKAAKTRSADEAAVAVGVDPDEFAWDRTRITEALLELDRRKVRASSDEVYGKTIASLRETRRSVRDAATGRSLDEQIAGLERERATLHRSEPGSTALAANVRRVAARRAEIDPKP